MKRRWSYDASATGLDGSSVDNPLGLLLLPVVLAVMWVAVWPWWFLAHWFGLRWVIAVECDG